MSIPTLTSPCIGICQINRETRLCLGCHRTINEIGAWSRMSEEERKEVMALLPERAKTNTPPRRSGRARLADKRRG
ncbi:DUF1289 domain-containing protein [Paracoccaceae bacterium GXU_MW_L88]